MTRQLHEEPPGTIWSMKISNCHFQSLMAQFELDGEPISLLIDTTETDLIIVNNTVPADLNATDNRRVGMFQLDQEIEGESKDLPKPFPQEYKIMYTGPDGAPPCNADGFASFGNSDLTTNNETSVLGHLLPTFKYAMFSVFVNPVDDATDGTASSELIWGGIDSRLYQNCLEWHSVGQWKDLGELKKSYWDFVLEGAFVGGVTLPSSKEATIDLLEYNMVIPFDALLQLIKVNQLECYQHQDRDDPADDEDYKPVECKKDEFDIVALSDCSKDFESIGFYVGGHTYYLSRDDLMYELENQGRGTICALRLQETHDLDLWIFGGVFLSRYYAAFDYERRRVGLAIRSAGNDPHRCPDDWSFDVHYDGLPVYEPSNKPIEIPAAPAMAPIPPPTKTEDAPSTTLLPIFMLLLASSILLLGCCCISGGGRKRNRRSNYSLASRRDDEDYGVELTMS